MPHFSGEELLLKIVHDHPDIPVIIVTGKMEIETAVGCMQAGAFDYLVKPVEEERLIAVIKRIIEKNQIQRENTTLKKQLLSGELRQPEAFAQIVTRDPAMISIFKYIEAIARSPEPVLLTGKTGVGKELIARAIHQVNGCKGLFVPVTVAGLDDNMFSDTLFGHKKGAFTDAHLDRAGLIERAAAGTLFLDEIGELSPISQVKLLRLLQEREYLPLGSDIPQYTSTHIVAATNQDLGELMKCGQFRKDLFYRLEVHHVHIPPLGQRIGDIPLLIEHFLEEAAGALGKKKPTPPRELFVLIATYPFPGNIRELRSMIYNAVSSHSRGVLSMKSFKDIMDYKRKNNIVQLKEGKTIGQTLFKFSSPLPSLKQAETLLIQEAMKQAGRNQSIAARLLGISRQTLNKKLKSTK